MSANERILVLAIGDKELGTAADAFVGMFQQFPESVFILGGAGEYPEGAAALLIVRQLTVQPVLPERRETVSVLLVPAMKRRNRLVIPEAFQRLEVCSILRSFGGGSFEEESESRRTIVISG